MRQWLWYHPPSKSCSFQPEGWICSLLGWILACLFVLGSRLRDEQSFHADGDGIKPSSPGQWNPDVLPVDSRSHNFGYRRQRSAVFPNEPQADQTGGRGAHRDGPDNVFRCGSRSLHAASSKVGDQPATGAHVHEGNFSRSWNRICELTDVVSVKYLAGTCSPSRVLAEHPTSWWTSDPPSKSQALVQEGRQNGILCYQMAKGQISASHETSH